MKYNLLRFQELTDWVCIYSPNLHCITIPLASFMYVRRQESFAFRTNRKVSFYSIRFLNLIHFCLSVPEIRRLCEKWCSITNSVFIPIEYYLVQSVSMIQYVVLRNMLGNRKGTVAHFPIETALEIVLRPKSKSEQYMRSFNLHSASYKLTTNNITFHTFSNVHSSLLFTYCDTIYNIVFTQESALILIHLAFYFYLFPNRTRK